MWILRTREGADPPFTFRLFPGAIKTIGRSTGAEFMVEASLVSRLHCRLSAGTGEIEVVDLDSTNGTLVNGTRIDRVARLVPGDTLGVGNVELLVEKE